MSSSARAAIPLLLSLLLAGCTPPGESDAAGGPSETGGAVAECATNAECGEGSYCAFDLALCGETPGRCEERPQICTMDYAPVCGCDGETYSNACQAAAAGVSVAAEGECGVAV